LGKGDNREKAATPMGRRPDRRGLILLVNQPDQPAQVLHAHPVLGVRLGHLHQGGKEWETPNLFLQLFAQLLFMTLKIFPLLGLFSATAGAFRLRILLSG